MIFNDDTTFQVAAILGIIFVNFVLQVRFMPYMGVREKAAVIREEAEERILSEIKRLERAQLLVRINGKSYYELMHKMRLEIDEQERIMSKHRHDFFNLNTIETMLLGALVFLCLCAVMTNSKYLLLRDYSLHSMVVVCVALAIIATTSLYFFLAFVHEIRTAAKKKKTRREMLWARIKSNSAKIRGMKGKLLNKSSSPFSLANMPKKGHKEILAASKRNLTVKVIPSSSRQQDIKVKQAMQSKAPVTPAKQVSGVTSEDNLSSISSTLSSSQGSLLTHSSSDAHSVSSSGSNDSDEDLQHFLRAEVRKIESLNVESADGTLISRNSRSKDISDNDLSSSNASLQSSSLEAEHVRGGGVESDGTSDDDAPTL